MPAVISPHVLHSTHPVPENTGTRVSYVLHTSLQPTVINDEARGRGD